MSVSPIQEMYSTLVAYSFHNIVNNDVLMCFFLYIPVLHTGGPWSVQEVKKKKSLNEHEVIQSNAAEESVFWPVNPVKLSIG